MADLKTTSERRDRFRSWLHDDTRDRLSIRAWCVAEDACDDVDTLIAENARLRAVAEAARDACNIALNDAGPEAFATIAELRRALAALGEP